MPISRNSRRKAATRVARPIDVFHQAKAQLRKIGVQGALLHALENLSALKPMRNGYVRCSGTFLARRMGYSAERANQLLRKLDQLGLIERYAHRQWIAVRLDAVKSITKAKLHRIRSVVKCRKLQAEIKRRKWLSAKTYVLSKRTKQEERLDQLQAQFFENQRPALTGALPMKGDPWKDRYGLP